MQRTPVYGPTPACDFDWSRHLSLAQAARDAKAVILRQATHDRDGDESGVRLYASLYRKHFGKKTWPGMLHRAVRPVLSAEKLCKEMGYDLGTYISAQMELVGKNIAHLKDRRGKPLGFQPNMLLGRGALKRYSAYIHAGHRKYQQSVETGFNVEDYAARFLLEAFVGEELWGMVRAERSPDMNAVWASMDTSQRAVWRKSTAPRGPEAALVQAARLDAAVHVAEIAQTGLSDRIGFHPPFVWPKFVVFVASLVPPKADDSHGVNRGEPGVNFWKKHFARRRTVDAGVR